MTTLPRTGRPLQALAVLGALIAGWLAGRWPLLQRDVQVAVMSAARAQLVADGAARGPLHTIRIEMRPPVPALPVPRTDNAACPELLSKNARRGAVYSSTRTQAGRVLVASAQRSGPVQKARIADRSRLRSGLPEATAQSSATTLLSAASTGPAKPFAASVPAATAAASAASPASAAAFDLATRAYAAQASGDRRRAARDFDAAIAADSGDPRGPAWAAARRALGRRWSGSAYVFARPGGNPGPDLDPGASPGGTPLLGGSQSGAVLAFALDPLARRPLELTARVTGSTGVDQRQAEAAVGVRWRLLTSLSLGAERLIALGPGGRHDWTVRLAGGRAVRLGPVAVDSYGETGIVGVAHPTYFAAAQARAGYPVAITPAFTLTPGAGLWGGLQRNRLAKINRVDVGPSLRLHWARTPMPVDVAVEYRHRVAGNAVPRSGAALTLSTGF